MSETILKINLKNDVFEVGDFITGYISVKTLIPLNISKLRLKFSKEKNIDVCKLEINDRNERERYKSNNVTYSFDFNLYTNSDSNDELSSGNHIFPFKFSLKPEDSSSTQIKGIYFDYLVNIENKYILYCDINVFGAYKPLYTVSKNVQIIDNLDRSKEFKTKIELSSFICLFKKNYDFSFTLNKHMFYSGDLIRLNVTVPTGLQNDVKKITCDIYEILSVSVDTINFIRTRYVVGGDARKEYKNYLIELRIPYSTSTGVSEINFNLKTIMFIDVIFYNTTPLRIKKYLQIVKKNIEIPEVDNLNVLEGETFDEKVFILN